MENVGSLVNSNSDSMVAYRRRNFESAAMIAEVLRRNNLYSVGSIATPEALSRTRTAPAQIRSHIDRQIAGLKAQIKQATDRGDYDRVSSLVQQITDAEQRLGQAESADDPAVARSQTDPGTAPSGDVYVALVFSSPAGSAVAQR